MEGELTRSVANPLGRVCIVCADPDVQQVDAALAEGVEIAQLARQLNVSRDAVYRHLRNHLRPALLERLKHSPELRASSLVERLHSIANDARDARLRAYAAGNAALGARLGDAEARALVALADRFKISHDDLATDAREIASLSRVIGQLARSHPDLGELVARGPDGEGLPEVAGELRAQVQRGRIQIQETKEVHS